MDREFQKYGLSSQVLEEITTLARKSQLDAVFLFGSRARGDYHKRSDIDLAISGGNITQFTLDIQEVPHTLLSFDIVNLNTPVDEGLRESILQEGICIYEKI
ncbi:MAG: nucleotidyltransferase domain-containing protein [Planctomycetia bacterium]|nr:nucleotidyltransferase domain-containing protein [Planctomycetia bacterium]MDO5112998.1 nucleotidyltransferase domain-containing protein [Planctomycetia bacterium]